MYVPGLITRIQPCMYMQPHVLYRPTVYCIVGRTERGSPCLTKPFGLMRLPYLVLMLLN